MAFNLKGSGDGGGVTPNINVTPLVDVVLVLLIIFMLVMPNMQDGKPIEMIKVEQADQLEDDQEPITVTIDGKEVFTVGEDDLPRDQALAEVLAEASASPRRRVLIRADARLHYKPVREFFRDLQQGGLVNIALAVGVNREVTEDELQSPPEEG